jgi:type II secretory pathway pseudopilin PulG
MARSPLRSSAGFTYIAVLFVVVVMGIMLGMVGQSWQMIMKREREEELLWRGMQYARAIARWNNPTSRIKTPLKELKDLLKDPRSLANVRYLPRLYEDPLTGKEFVPITDPALGVIGVRSASNEAPLRQGNFEDKFDFSIDTNAVKPNLKQMLKGFEGKTKYSEWEFSFKPQQAGKVDTSGKISTLPPAEITKQTIDDQQKK